MKRVIEASKKFIKDEEGLTVVEYAVAGGVLAGAVAVAFSGFGNVIKGEIRDIFAD